MATVRLNADTRRFRKFSKRYLRFVEGSVGGQPVEFEPWLLGVTNEILSRDPVTGLRQYTTAYLGLAKKNNKSTWMAALALYFLVVESALSNDKGMQVYAIAASKDQAKIVFQFAKRMVEASPLLSDYLGVFRDSIVNLHTGARFEVLSADAPKTHGKGASIVLCDELHAHESGELYDALLSGMIARDEPLMIIATNAGSNEKGSSKCAEVYRLGKSGADPKMFFWSPTVTDAELGDHDAWLRVNPSSWITLEKLLTFQKKYPPFMFERMHLNRWTRAEKQWLPRGAWAGLHVPGSAPKPHERVVVGLDMSKSIDTTALVIAAVRADGHYGVSLETWGAWADPDRPPPETHHVIEADTIPTEVVFNRLREIMGTYFDVAAIAYDPYRIPDVVAEALEAEGLPMVKFPQGHVDMCRASQGLFEAVAEKRIEHDGDPIFDAHVAAATPKDVPGKGWRLDKDAAHSPSDGAVALAMAVDEAREYTPAGEDDFSVRWL